VSFPDASASHASTSGSQASTSGASAGASAGTPAVFYFDLASPEAYLAAERILHVIPVAAEWQPVLARELPGAESFEAFRCEREREIFCLNVERRAEALGLQPMRWPEPFPFDSALAMRVATYAKGIGRLVPFAQAAFRQAFAGGHSLEQEDFVLIAAAACEMHPAAVLRGAQLRSVREQLDANTARAAAAGVRDVPTVRIDDPRPGGHAQLFSGERTLAQAADFAQSATGMTRVTGAMSATDEHGGSDGTPGAVTR
jgi:2-hydroxychromene-2-carboxylate isomerase